MKVVLPFQVSPELFVDTTRHQKLRINIDIVLPKLPCACKCGIVCYVIICG